MSAVASSLPPNAARLPHDPGVLKQLVDELLATVTRLRTTIDQQQAHIQPLVRMTFGRRTERAEEPTPFDLDRPPDELPAPSPEASVPEVTVKRRGHGCRDRPSNLPREREVLDLTEAEKTCPCCVTQRVRIGADVSERLDSRPACPFVRVLEQPTYVRRRCERQGDNIQAVQAPLPPEPIPRGIVGAGLLAHVLVSKWLDHLPLDRLEGFLARCGA
jgi:transposase/uncharacterized coiled-coil protein SlyX